MQAFNKFNKFVHDVAEKYGSKFGEKYGPYVRAFLIFLIPSFAIGLLLGLYPGYKTYSYVWKDDRFCTSCHVHDYASEGWKNSVHGKLTTCHDCHHQPLHQYALEPLILITKNPKFPKDLHKTPNVPKGLCQSCHMSNPTEEQRATLSGPLEELQDLSRLPKVDKMWLHKLHLEKKVQLALPSEFHLSDQDQFGYDVNYVQKNKELPPERAITCVDCHGSPANRAHNFTATDRSCIRCHNRHGNNPVQAVGCRNCHFQDFMVPVEEEAATK